MTKSCLSLPYYTTNMRINWIQDVLSISTHAYLSDYAFIHAFHLACLQQKFSTLKITQTTKIFTNVMPTVVWDAVFRDICFPEAWLVICGSDLCNLFPWSHPKFNVKLELYVSPMWGWVRGLEISSKGVWSPSIAEHKHRWQTWWFCNEYIHTIPTEYSTAVSGMKRTVPIKSTSHERFSKKIYKKDCFII